MIDLDSKRELLYGIVEKQISDGTPPETKQTYDRLIGEGQTHDDAMGMLSTVFVYEMNNGLKEQKPFNDTRYVEALNALPELP